ncbi:hypothetical protein YUMDRAFT_01541 [Streptomyces sp. OspMP-M45]|nr:hypothetical protein YUMDRAFT_01541 [Streptomyces sp. OspMP-M45]
MGRPARGGGPPAFVRPETAPATARGGPVAPSRSVSGAYRRRTGAVKGGPAAVGKPSTRAGRGWGRGFAQEVPETDLSKELTMADAAFVVTTLAVFALVALIARGVAKL